MCTRKLVGNFHKRSHTDLEVGSSRSLYSSSLGHNFKCDIDHPRRRMTQKLQHQLAVLVNAGIDAEGLHVIYIYLFR